MQEPSKEEVSLLLNDLHYLRNAIQKNSLIIQQIALSRSLRLTFLFSGISVIIFSLFSLYIKFNYHSFFNAPLSIKTIFFISIFIALIISGLLKCNGILKEAKQLKPGISLLKISTEIYSNRIMHVIATVIFFTLFFVLLAISKNFIHLLIPIISTGIAILYILLYTFLNIRNFLLIGYWHALTAIIVFLFPEIKAEFGCILTFGFGMIFTAALSYIFENKSVRAKV